MLKHPSLAAAMVVLHEHYVDGLCIAIPHTSWLSQPPSAPHAVQPPTGGASPMSPPMQVIQPSLESWAMVLEETWQREWL